MTLMAVIPASISWLCTQVSSCWNSLPTLAISLFLVALLVDHVKRRKRCSRYPPGPTPLPFIGDLLSVDVNNPHKVILHWEKFFGPVFSFQIGWTNFVVLSGFKMIKEALGQKAESFIDRPAIPLLKLIGYRKNCEGISIAKVSSGWKEQRRFCVSTLKYFGKKTLENKVYEEAEYLCSEVKSTEGSFFHPGDLISKATFNIICVLVCGNRFEYSDENLQKLISSKSGTLKQLSRILPQVLPINIPSKCFSEWQAMLDHFLIVAGTWLSYIPGPHRKVQKLHVEFSTIIRECVNEHKKTRDPTCPRDFIDLYLEEIEKAKGNPESSFNEQNLICAIFDLMTAGTETTYLNILWGILQMALYPDIQKRVHEEIDKVIGRAKSPMVQDQLNLPYTCAVMHEIQRFSCVLPLLFPYKTSRDTELGRFIIPKDTIVVNHLYSVLKDETMWEKPHEFYPEHFLDENGRFVKREDFLPFSIGRHSCPGEQLAKTQIFILTTSLLQHFTICMDENCPTPKEENAFYALAVNPPPFKIRAIPR